MEKYQVKEEKWINEKESNVFNEHSQQNDPAEIPKECIETHRGFFIGCFRNVV